ncbi:MAG: UDP-N-acetylglucosamine 2-epimerase [Acidobacteria bacterium]|nr:UDP-N-acetylglucosamine 2-epimerase [Acidobacteriota bacterium]
MSANSPTLIRSDLPDLSSCLRPVGKPVRKVLTVFGTRPEVIKLSPVIQQLAAFNQSFQTVNVSTGQHTDLLYPFVQLFDIPVAHDLGAMEPGQTPNQLCARVMSALDYVLSEEQPDLILVQGDTTTALAGALAGFHRRIPVAHVEAGLRSGNLSSPYPEEINRRLITGLASYHFAVTTRNRDTLLAEGIARSSIFFTGNPVVDSLKTILGQRPIGFRGPGYSLSPATLRVLVRRGYQYDASTLPTFLGPLARAYYLMTAKLTEEEKQKRQVLFGKLRDGLQPLKPYRWQVEDRTIVEIPVTTMPLFKVPIHFSYLIYLSLYSTSLALQYFNTALKLCRLRGVQPSLLLHPLDLLGSDDTQDLSFFPGMKVASEKKLEIVSRALHLMSDQFTILALQQHAGKANASELTIVESKTLRVGETYNVEALR